MSEQKVSTSNKQVQIKYTRQNLILGSFILHSHPNTDSRNCTKSCKYIFMNEVKQIEHNDCQPYDEKQIFDQSKCKGHPESLIKATLKENITMFDFLIEIYSIYMHLEITHKIFAEFAMPTEFQSSTQQYQFIDSFQPNCVIIIYADKEPYYEFTIFNLRSSPKSEEKDKIIVPKSNLSNSNVMNLKDKSVTQNEWIVIFQWILFNKRLHQSNCSLEFEPIIAKLRLNQKAIEQKLSQIRQRSYTRLYDLSCFFVNQ